MKPKQLRFQVFRASEGLLPIQTQSGLRGQGLVDSAGGYEAQTQAGE